MNESSKATNNEIVKSLIYLVQDFLNTQYGDRDQGRKSISVNQDNLVFQISYILASHRRQKDRIEDVMANMKRIMEGG